MIDTLRTMTRCIDNCHSRTRSFLRPAQEQSTIVSHHTDIVDATPGTLASFEFAFTQTLRPCSYRPSQSPSLRWSWQRQSGPVYDLSDEDRDSAEDGQGCGPVLKLEQGGGEQGDVDYLPTRTHPTKRTVPCTSDTQSVALLRRTRNQVATGTGVGETSTVTGAYLTLSGSCALAGQRLNAAGRGPWYITASPHRRAGTTTNSPHTEYVPTHGTDATHQQEPQQ